MTTIQIIDGDANTMPTSRLTIAAILALTILSFSAGPSLAQGPEINITRSDIAAYKAALRLRPMQEIYWVPVAVALRNLPAEGRSLSVDAQTIGRLMPALRPLFASLDDDQKRIALALAQRIGLTQFAGLI